MKADKSTGGPKYIRLPGVLEKIVRDLATDHGREFTNMAVYLIALGCHSLLFDLREYTVDPNIKLYNAISAKRGKKGITNKLRFEVLKRDDFTCKYCGRKSPQVILEVDHVMPESNGGKTEKENLVTCCFECNRGKGHAPLSIVSTQLGSRKE